MAGINEYMWSLGREEIFPGIGEADYEEIDFEPLIEKYRYLMSEPDPQ